MREVNSIAVWILPDLHKSNIEGEKVWGGGTGEDWDVSVWAVDVETEAGWGGGSC